MRCAASSQPDRTDGVSPDSRLGRCRSVGGWWAPCSGLVETTSRHSEEGCVCVLLWISEGGGKVYSKLSDFLGSFVLRSFGASQATKSLCRIRRKTLIHAHTAQTPVCPRLLSTPSSSRADFPCAHCNVPGSEMDVIPMCSIFQELQIVHDTGFFSALPSLEEYWQQVNTIRPYPALCQQSHTHCRFWQLTCSTVSVQWRRQDGAGGAAEATLWRLLATPE